MLKKIVFSALFIVFITGCTKDDICTEETPKTPLLIIKFKSKVNPLLSKEVSNLTVLLSLMTKILISTNQRREIL